MRKLTFNLKSDKNRFAFMTTLFAFGLGYYCYTLPIIADHLYFFISAPIATFFPCYYFWKYIFKSKNDNRIFNVIAVTLILTFITHYLNHVIYGIGEKLYYYLFNNNQIYLGDDESVIGILTYESFWRMFISLYGLGILTFAMFTLIGIYVIKTSKIK